MIEIKNVHKIYYSKISQTLALKNVSIKLAAGKVLAIIGSSGSGKSTLARCINLLEKPTSGQIIIGGKDLTQLSVKELAIERKQIGMIFQQFNLLASKTVEQNISFPLDIINMPKEEKRKKISELLRLVDLEEKVNAYPANLSGGQKQRVAIARALASNPKILLCDEATSALDPGTTKSILNLLRDINIKLGITIVMITHEPQVARSICDEVAVIHNGVLVEYGSVVEVFTNPQSDFTKEFINYQKSDLPEDYNKTILPEGKGENSKVVLRLEFNSDSKEAESFQELANHENTKLKIISAHVDYVAGKPVGSTLLEIHGTNSQIEKVLNEWRIKQIKVNKLGYV